MPGPSLAQAQLVLAREYGFASWPPLVEEVAQRRARAADEAGFVAAWLTWAIGQGDRRPQPERAWALAHTRATAQRDAALVLALACGDLATVQRLLPPSRVHEPLPPLAAPPIAIARVLWPGACRRVPRWGARHGALAARARRRCQHQTACAGR
jgi:hypothetical protein